MLYALIIAWLLNQIGGFGTIFINGMAELFQLHITMSGYYVIFFLAGLIIDLLNGFRYYHL